VRRQGAALQMIQDFVDFFSFLDVSGGKLCSSGQRTQGM